ncbi:MAG TPA: monovalent cation/H(+) antiporter subunit G [Actinomycetota bacterium]|jgi:multicomponent Na+:H+ antiporter subunit G
MTPVVAVLLGLALVTTVVSALGLLLMPNLFDRLHYLGPATTVAPVLVAAAVVAAEAFDHQGIEAVLLAVFLVLFQPVLTHATARAARIRDRGDWRIRDEGKGRRGSTEAARGRAR